MIGNGRNEQKIAHFPLDFSVCGAEGATTMDAQVLETTLRAHFGDARPA